MERKELHKSCLLPLMEPELKMSQLHVSAEETLKRRKGQIKIQEQLERLQIAVENEDENLDDEDAKMLITKAKELKVAGPTVSLNPSPLRVFHPSRELLFDEETLDPEIFFENGASRLKKIFRMKKGLRNLLQSNAFPAMPFTDAEKTSVLRYFFYVMSIHQDNKVAKGCYRNLLLSKFKPSLSDLVNIFVNWGVNLEDFSTEPEGLLGVRPVLKRGHALWHEVAEHNMFFVVSFINLVAEKRGGREYLCLVGPLSRMMFDRKILESGLRNTLKLTIQAIVKSGVPPLSTIQLSDLDFPTRTVLCVDALQHTPVGARLAYVVLQLFLGARQVRHGPPICLEHLLELILARKEALAGVSCLDVYCLLRLLVCCMEAAAESVGQAIVNSLHKELISSISENVSLSEKSCDPTLVKEQLSRIHYYWNLSQQHSSFLQNCRSLGGAEGEFSSGCSSDEAME